MAVANRSEFKPVGSEIFFGRAFIHRGIAVDKCAFMVNDGWIVTFGY